MTEARIIVKIKKMGEEFADTVEESDWEVLDPVGSMDGEVAGETVDEKAPGSCAVEFTVDLRGICVNREGYAG